MKAAQLILPCPSWAEGQDCGPLSFPHIQLARRFLWFIPSPDGRTDGCPDALQAVAADDQYRRDGGWAPGTWDKGVRVER